MRRFVRTATLSSIVLAMLIMSQGAVPSGGTAVAAEKRAALWLLIELHGVPGVPDATGILLISEDETPPTPVRPDLVFPAVGVISPAEIGCQPPPTGTHYHGTLFGLPDPNPSGCGWSRAVRAPLGSLADYMGRVITLEESARLNLRETPPDFHRAMRDASAARIDLKRAVREITDLVKDGVIEKTDGDAAVEALEGARAIDELALDAIKHHDLDNAVGLLGDALAIKRDVFRSLESAGVLF